MDLMKIFKTISKIAKKEKVEVCVVGGYVRDRLLGKSETALKDVDFVVQGSGLEFAKAFDKELKQTGSLVEFAEFDTARYVFPVHKVCKVHKVESCEVGETIELEFAGARSEKYDDKSRKPKVEATSLEEDLKRRDFTVNAMAQKVGLSGLSKKIIDPFGGQEDLKKKILRTPLEPCVTFSEDPLRMMRAARFAAQLGFELDAGAKKAISDNRQRIKIISAERIQEEMGKLLMTNQPSVGLWILFDTKLLHEFLPELADCMAWKKLMVSITKITSRTLCAWLIILLPVMVVCACAGPGYCMMWARPAPKSLSKAVAGHLTCTSIWAKKLFIKSQNAYV